MTPRAIGQAPESAGRAGRSGGPSDPSSSRPRQRVDPAGPRIRARVTRDSWSTPQALEPGPCSPGTSGRAPGTTVSRGSWSTPRAQGHGPEAPQTAGRTRGHWNPAPGRPGYLVEPWDLRHGPESPGAAGRLRGSRDTGLRRPAQLFKTAGTGTRARVPWDSWSTPRDHGPKRASPRTAGRHLRASDPGLSRPGQLVDTAGTGTRPPVARDI